VPGRVFVAVELPVPARDLIVRATEAFVAADPAWAGEKFVAPGLLHVTMAFVGAIPDDAVGELVERIREGVASLPHPTADLGRMRTLPSLRSATMLWATVEGECAPMAELAAVIASAAGLPPAPRPFHPHITVARARRPRPADPAALAVGTAVLSKSGTEADRSVSVRSVTVFSSTLGLAGPTYERLAVLSLGQA
jgi:2'-5' RNA ligase